VGLFSKQRLLIILLLIVIVPIGFFTKFYSGPAQDWISNSVGGLFYEIFWCLVLYFLFSKTRILLLAMIVFLTTCFLEFMQLWHPSFLEYLRSNFIGRTILGNAFNWMDFPYYIVGSFLGYVLLKFISKISDK
jgi:hypothetical protein